ncbi:GNAT family N-acetyltransferase [Piscicoccus intestinalis]|uniref:GNAT family N-acetyltransferase n=1 Tax=Piscicoccus intestinalis TaxID=746033 RepID=UPI000837DC66|nr:GNAT family N-acetyltransferase [Piscicoccus intestinalis]
MPIDLPLATDRLRLRLHRPDDLEPLFAIYADPGVVRFLLHEPWTREDAREHLDKRVERVGLGSPARALALVIERDGLVVGDLALWLTGESEQLAEIGWMLSPECAGQGLAAEAAAALIDAALVDGLRRIEAQMDARNDASARLCERLGMTREAHLRQNWWSKGEWTDTLVFGLLATDPR